MDLERGRVCGVDELVCSTLQLNSSLSEAYAAHVLSGKSLLLTYETHNCTSSALPSASAHDVSVSRNFSRLCTVFKTFAQADEAAGPAKECNTFFSPQVTTGHDTIESHIQVWGTSLAGVPQDGRCTTLRGASASTRHRE